MYNNKAIPKGWAYLISKPTDYVKLSVGVLCSLILIFDTIFVGVWESLVRGPTIVLGMYLIGIGIYALLKSNGNRFYLHPVHWGLVIIVIMLANIETWLQHGLYTLLHAMVAGGLYLQFIFLMISLISILRNRNESIDYSDNE